MRTGNSTDSQVSPIVGLGARLKWALVAFFVAAVSFASGPAAAQCTSPNPNDWPASAKPYFMIIMDTSGSMDSNVGSRDSCDYGEERRDHGRCAIKNTVQAFSEANFGLTTFAGYWETAPYCHGHGSCAGANVVVNVQKQGTPTNVPEILKWVNNVCSDGELWANGSTPLGESLRAMKTYFEGDSSPLKDDTSLCRSVNVILVTDGNASDCDSMYAPDEAESLRLGVTTTNSDNSTTNWSVLTHVINFGGGSGDAIANKGGTGSAIAAADEATLSAALAKIIAGAILPENCNNVDDNCNGCIDEGYAHFCNERSDCCTAARQTCLTAFANSGNQSDLPCVSEAQQTNSSAWLCADPGETCDGDDNNCNGQVDEGFGNPVCCPRDEQCNGVDDDCDGVVDEGASGTPYSLPGCVECQPSAEICDGCDNDCDGLVDENIDALDCGFSPPANCAGTRVCAQLADVTEAGACHASGNS